MRNDYSWEDVCERESERDGMGCGMGEWKIDTGTNEVHLTI